jgi:DNA-damage-inducible protein D
MRSHCESLFAAAASVAGVVIQRDFAIFQDHGYMGLYAGERARDIHARKGRKQGQHILDHMGSTALAANWFRATPTQEKLCREGIVGKEEANRTHLLVRPGSFHYAADPVAWGHEDRRPRTELAAGAR